MSEPLKVGDRCVWAQSSHIDTALIYTIIETKTYKQLHEVRVSWKEPEEDNFYRWYNANEFIKIGERKMTAKKCICDEKETKPVVVIDHAEVVKNQLHAVIQNILDNGDESEPETALENSCDYPEVEALKDVLEQFGYEVSINTLGFEVILDKRN